MADTRLFMVYHEYGNDEVQFTVSIPWSAKLQSISDDQILMDSLYYLRDMFGLDPMRLRDAYLEEE